MNPQYQNQTPGMPAADQPLAAPPQITPVGAPRQNYREAMMDVTPMGGQPQQTIPQPMPLMPQPEQQQLPPLPQYATQPTMQPVLPAQPIQQQPVYAAQPAPMQQPAPIAPPQPQPTVVAPTIPQPAVVAPQAVAVSSGANGGETTPPAKKANANSTQNTLQIAEIRDGIVIMNDGSYRSVVMVKSINFDLMSQQEQEAVEYSYQGFLNSLYFPVQIFLRSQKVDLRQYIEKLDKIRTEHDNMLLALLMEDYVNYIDQLSQQTNIMDKKFYVVIPFFPVTEVKQALTQSKTFLTGLADMFSNKEQHVTVNEADLEAAKTELRNRVQAVLNGLMQCGIQGLPLDTQELIELYYDTYNPDTATRQELKDFNSLTADVITKGQGAAPQAHLQRELQ